MNNDGTVRDKNNMIIGWCRDMGSIIQAIGIRKGYCGYYNKSSNITFDKEGRVYCYGNATDCLVRIYEGKI